MTRLAADRRAGRRRASRACISATFVSPVAVLAFAHASLAAVVPPGVENPKVVLAAAEKAAASKRKAAREMCLKKPVAERAACNKDYTAEYKSDVAAAQAAFDKALPAWQTAVAQANRTYRVEAARCKKLPAEEREPCTRANDAKYQAK